MSIMFDETNATHFNFKYLCESNDYRNHTEYERIVNGTQGYILWGIVFVLIAMFSLVGNIVTILVLRRDPLMSALTILLIALAISDMLAPQANALIAFSHYHLSNKFGDSVSYLRFSDFIRFIVQPLSTMFTMSSSWIVTLATFFRLIAVMWPFKARTLINKKCAMLSLFIIFGFSSIFIIPIYSSLETTVKCTPDNKTQYEALGIVMNSDFLRKAYMPTMQVMCFYLPWLIALTLWLFLLRSLRKSEKNFNFTFHSSNNSSNINHAVTNNNSIYNTLDKALMVKRESFNANEANSNNSSSFYYHNCNVRFINSGSSTNTHNNNNNNTDSRMNNAQTRLRSYNKITLMVVVLCFTNLICRVFTFVFIFESIFNEYMARNMFSFNANLYSNNNNESLANSSLAANEFFYEDAKIRFPKFLSYSLLLNNIFLCINHSCNIFIYTFTNPRFKRNLVSLAKRSVFCHPLNKSLNHGRLYRRHESDKNLQEKRWLKSARDKFVCFCFMKSCSRRSRKCETRMHKVNSC